jgi:recombination protein RecT
MPDNALVILERQMAPLAPRFAEVLGKTMPVERLMRTIMISVERLPKLLDCDRQSIFNAAMSAACLGLEVDGVTGQAYLIPFKGKAQLVIGYKGINTMAARSGITITGAVVRDGDQFDYELGSDAFVKHVPALGNKGRIVATWAVAAANGARTSSA